MFSIPRYFSICFLLIILFLTSSCSDTAYLMQCVKGHFSIMSQAKPIEDILQKSSEQQSVRDQLVKVVSLRSFAVDSLHLPDNGSYHEYVDLNRPYAVWNLVVAPELSLQLNQWCFPVVGCVTYRGYFDKATAQTMANRFSLSGFDVDIYGVQAYSTLNWFDDPVLNTFLDQDESRLAALLFHEMAHQIVYVKNDTVFNESFAKTIEIVGLGRWFKQSGSDEDWNNYLLKEEQSTDFHQFLSKIRDDLHRVYDSSQNNQQKRLAKRDIFIRAFKNYEDLKARWNGYDGFDSWMNQGLNNARLSSMATYYDLVPAFQSLYNHVDNDLDRFYAEVSKLAALPAETRRSKLESYLSPSLTSLY